jgi:hypothetical protein
MTFPLDDRVSTWYSDLKQELICLEYPSEPALSGLK